MATIPSAPVNFTRVCDADRCSAAEGPWPLAALAAPVRNLVILLDTLTADAQARAAGYRDHADRIRWLAQRQAALWAASGGSPRKTASAI